MTTLRKVTGYSPEVRALARQVGNLAEDIEGGAGAAAETTTAQIDFILSSITNITNILGGQLFYNVKDFGAKGNGSHNDTSAIQSAEAAAAATAYGGIVFSPPGNYRITSAIASSARVHFVGSGASSTSWTMDDASANILELTKYTTGHVQWQHVHGITFKHAQSNSGHCLVFVDSGTYKISACEFGHRNNGFTNGEIVIDSGADTWSQFEDCWFYAGTDEAIALDAPYPAIGLFRGCHFQTPSGAYSPPGHGAVVYGANLFLHNCEFYTGQSTSGTFACYKSSTADTYGGVHDTRFIASGGATVTGIALGTYSEFAWFTESGNVFDNDTNFTAYSYTVTGSAVGALVRLESREHRAKRYSSNAATLTLAADQYGAIYVDRTGNAACTYTTTLAPEGAGLRVVIYASGGAGSGVQTVDITSELTAVTIATTKTASWSAVATVVASTLVWEGESVSIANAMNTHAALTTGAHGMTAFGSSLVDDANAAAGCATLGAEQISAKDAVSGYAGLNSTSRITKGAITADDLIVTDSAKGLVLKDTQGTPHYWRISVSVLGVVTTADLGTSPP